MPKMEVTIEGKYTREVDVEKHTNWKGEIYCTFSVGRAKGVWKKGFINPKIFNPLYRAYTDKIVAFLRMYKQMLLQVKDPTLPIGTTPYKYEYKAYTPKENEVSSLSVWMTWLKVVKKVGGTREEGYRRQFFTHNVFPVDNIEVMTLVNKYKGLCAECRFRICCASPCGYIDADSSITFGDMDIAERYKNELPSGGGRKAESKKRTLEKPDAIITEA